MTIGCTPGFAVGRDLLDLRDAIGAENIVMGSDYPHGEGLEDPRDLLLELDGFSENEIRLVMRENGFGLMQPPAF